MSLILINRVTSFTEDGGFIAETEMINTEDIKKIRPWHLKGDLKEQYPDGFSLVLLKNEDQFKVNINGLTPGFYLVRVRSGLKVTSRKLVVSDG